MSPEIDMEAIRAIVDEMSHPETSMLVGTLAGMWARLAARHPESAPALLDGVRARALRGGG